VTFDLAKIIDSKRAYRRKLADMPIGDKLRLLDVLRERAISLQSATRHAEGIPSAPSETSTARRSNRP
jgi:hypothetical protein